MWLMTSSPYLFSGIDIHGATCPLFPNARCGNVRRRCSTNLNNIEIVWFRPGDLRVEDHVGLRAAAASAAAVCLCATGPRRLVKSLGRLLWQKYRHRLVQCTTADDVAAVAMLCRARKVHVHSEPIHPDEHLTPVSKVADIVQWSGPLRHGIQSLEEECKNFVEYQEKIKSTIRDGPFPAPLHLPPEPSELDMLVPADHRNHEEDICEIWGAHMLNEWAANPNGFAEQFLWEIESSCNSNEAWALNRIIQGCGISGLAPAEVFLRTFSSLLGNGVVSLRQVAQVAANTDAAVLAAIEAKEWHRLLALRDVKEGFKYWRWRGYLIRYTETGSGPAALCIHGFGGSAEQFIDLMGKIQGHKLYALDLLGYGHSEKPPLSYTQYLWEELIVDFIRDVIRAPCLLIGNSIGGYFSALAACAAPHLCRGLVLLNTAGTILPPDDWNEQKSRFGSVLDRMNSGSLPPYDPAPAWLLDGFSHVVFWALFLLIEPILEELYPSSPKCVTARRGRSIQRDALDPFATTVVCAFPRFAPTCTLNELIEGFGGRVLVVQGMADLLQGGPTMQQKRIECLKACGADAIPLQEVGHCPQDEVPSLVASAIQEWCAKQYQTEIMRWKCTKHVQYTIHKAMRLLSRTR